MNVLDIEIVDFLSVADNSETLVHSIKLIKHKDVTVTLDNN